MVSLTTTVCLVLLGAVCLANAAPTSLPQGDLAILVDAAKLLYDTLSQAVLKAELQQIDAPPGSNINHGDGTAVNGNGNFNFYDEVNGVHINDCNEKNNS